jgi:simple sugar transport system permease protein
MSSIAARFNAETPAERRRGLVYDFIVKYGMLVAIGILILFFSTQNDAFLTVNNLLLIARAVSILCIVAIGVTISVSVDGFDVSVGAVTGLSVLLSTSLMVIWNVEWACVSPTYWRHLACCIWRKAHS